MLLFGAAAAGLVQGLAGFGLGLVAAVFWSGALAPQVAAPLVAICSLAGQMLTIRTVARSIDLRGTAPMLLGGLAGVPVGVALLPLIDPSTFRLSVGVLLCLYCPSMLVLKSLPKIRWGGGWADAAAGVAGGIMGGIAGLSGPAPTIWCAVRGWDRDRSRAAFQSFLIVAQAAGLLGYAVSGLLTREVWRLSAWMLPFVLAPSLLGARLYGRLGGEAFRRLILVVLLATGAVLVVKGLH